MLMRNPDLPSSTDMAAFDHDPGRLEQNRRHLQDTDAEFGLDNNDVNRELFHNTHIRHAFIRKVYMIVLLQLAITAGMIVLFMKVEALKSFAEHNIWISIGPLLGAIVVLLFISCGPECLRKKFPWNAILLGLFTFLFSISIGAVSSLRSQEIVLIAFGITALIVLIITLLAFQTWIDITDKGYALMICLGILLLVGIGLGIAAIFVGDSETFKTIHLLYCVLGVMVFTCLLFYDTQLLIGGKHKFAISPEDYILASLSIYLVIFFQ